MRSGDRSTGLSGTKSNRALAACILLGIAARALLFGVQSGDYVDFLQPWFEALRGAGGLAAIGQPVGDYLPTYIYLLAALTHLPLPSLVSIKLVSCLGDFVLAVYCGRLTEKVRGKTAGRAAFAAVWLLPTVLLNSAAWAQCDAIYTAGLVACVYYSIEEKPVKALLAFGVAFAFKLQAVFLAPFLLLLWANKRVRFCHFWLVPLVYGVAVLPAALAGRPVADLLGIYLRQTSAYAPLALNAPNFYSFFWWVQNPQAVGRVCVAVFMAALLGLAVYLFRRPATLSPRLLVQAALLSLLLVPFLLPHMHERYFYPADILAVVYCVACGGSVWVPAVVVGCSVFTYGNFLFGWGVPAAALSIPMAGVIVYLFYAAKALLCRNVNGIMNTVESSQGKEIRERGTSHE